MRDEINLIESQLTDYTYMGVYKGLLVEIKEGCHYWLAAAYDYSDEGVALQHIKVNAGRMEDAKDKIKTMIDVLVDVLEERDNG